MSDFDTEVEVDCDIGLGDSPMPDEALAYARCVLAALFDAEAHKLAAAVRRRVRGGCRKVGYTLRIELPDTDEMTGMLQPVASSKTSEVSEVRRLMPIPLFGQHTLDLENV